MRKIFVLLGIIGILGLVSAIFFFRSQVLLVTDVYFTTLYGERRTKIKTIETSLRLFRRVKLLTIPDDAGADLIAFSVNNVKGKKYGVLFPYRYIDGARRYKEQASNIPVYVFGGRAQNRDQDNMEGIIFIGNDAYSDLYRAGGFAAIFAEKSGGGDVIFFQNEYLSTEERNIFEEGLKNWGFEKLPRYVSMNQDYSDNQNVSCMVMKAPATQFLEENLDLQVILFSWVDPALSPSQVKVMFDDSIWAFAVKALRIKNSHVLPSEIVFPESRIQDKGVLRNLKNTISNTPKL